MHITNKQLLSRIYSLYHQTHLQMKKLLSIFLLIISQFAHYALAQAPTRTAKDYIQPYTAPFQYGINLGYYNANWPDEKMAGIAQAAGVHSVRPALPESFLESYGYNIRENTFKAYASTYGMKELTCFLEGPSAAHRDMTTYPGGTQPSRLFAHLYEPIWNDDGSVNANNYFANYLYKLLPIYGDNVRFWEIVNEPDYTYGASQNQWLTRPPLPDEVSNLRAPIFNYIRMLRISYEVIKKYRPNAYITVGGVGYPQFVDALLRYTDNPNGGAVTTQYPNTGGAYIDAMSYHSYPNYSLHYWDSSINAFRYTRTSDYAVNQMLKERQGMVDVLSKYGYDGGKYPAKHLLMSETNIARRTSSDRTGTDEMQRNYGIKALVLAQKTDIKQFYLYQLGESVNAPAPGNTVSGSDEIALMGLYENLMRDAPGAQRITQLGQAFATTSKLLYGWQYDAARTAALALPSSMNGAAFSKSGVYSYVLWAKALTDNSESANATYSFPAAWGMTTVDRYEWNNSATNAKNTQSAQNISLTSAPVFFTAPTGTGAIVPTPTPGVGCTGTGSLLREQWDNVNGSTVADVPTGTPPTSSAAITQFESSAQSSYNYAARVRGYICPPQAGTYSFWIVGDDAAELYLSTDADPAHKVRLATCSGWTSSSRDFTRTASQHSAAVQLQAGQRYYIEALHKQAWGTGYLAVAWTLPSGTRQEPIPGANLIPFAASTTTTLATPSSTATISGTKARITFTFSAPPTSATSTIAPILYNKTRVLQFEEDDSPAMIYTDAYLLLKGGVRNGQTYPGLRYTDGCGHSRAYTAAVAINGHNTYDNSVWLDAGATHAASKLVWAQAQEMLNHGWDIENHSDLHTATNPAQQITNLNALIANRLQGYKPAVHIVPTNFAGYPTAAFAAGYAAVSSNSQSDNLPMINTWNGDRVALSTLPAPTTPFVYNRYLADPGSNESPQALTSRLNNLSDALMAPGTSTKEVYLQRVFTHGIGFDVLSSWMNHTQSIARDQLWVTTLREFAEYRRVSSQVVKTETLSGNTLTVDLDYARVSANTRFQNLTLLANSSGTLTNITVTGADSATFNTTTKMVNVFRRQAAATTTSSTTSLTSTATLANSKAADPAIAPTEMLRTAVTVFPNPFNQQDGRTSVQFLAPRGGEVSVSLYNLQGQLVRQLFHGTVEPGTQRTLALEAAGLSDGLYIVRLVTAGEVVNQKVVLGR